jgi:hypothetical protein
LKAGKLSGLQADKKAGDASLSTISHDIRRKKEERREPVYAAKLGNI